MESRVDIINFLANRFGYKSYLEIGLRHPWEWVEFFEESQNTDDWGLKDVEIEFEVI